MYSLYAPTWTARKLDKKVTKQAKEANGVSDTTNAGNFNKLTLPDCKTLSDLSSYIGATRSGFYLMTAPWGEARGVRVGKAENHMELMQWFGDRKAGLVPLLSAFEVEYPSKVAEMEFTLHDMFNPNDYPMWADVRAKFDLRLSTQPLPNINDVRVLEEIPQHVRDEIEASIREEQDKVYEASLAHAYGELLTPVAHLAKQLKAYDSGEIKKLYASLMDNVRTMAQAAGRLNIARDPTVDALARDAENMLDGVTQEDLKTSLGTRVTIAGNAEKLAARIAAFLP